MLTNRRVEFLKTLTELYDSKGEPVHYTDVAQAMKISKWTAYDILKELEKGDFVKTEYYLGEEKSQGRSTLRFLPTEKAYEIFKKADKDEWNSLRDTLIKKVKNSKSNSLEEIVNEMFQATKPIEFCAYAITVFLLKLRMTGGLSMESIENLLASVNPTSSLVLFVGAVLGVLLYTKVKSDIDKKLAENIQKFYINLNKLNSQDVNLLNNFLRELIAIV